MAQPIPVTLGGFTFKSKADAKKALRAIRDKHSDRKPIYDEDDVELLLGVVAVHPQATEKMGAGIDGFFVAKAPQHSTHCFYLCRTDGSETDFSWNEALSPTTPLNRLRTACREAIKQQKINFKDTEWPSQDDVARVCPITGKKFARVEAHVDHQPPETLSVLVGKWLKEESLNVEDVSVNHTGDVRAVDTFTNEAQRTSWVAFHKQHAILRLVSAKC